MIVLIWGGIVALTMIIGYYSVLIADRIFAWKSSRLPKTQKAEFISDCYKLQQKWALKGEYEYASALGQVILAFNLPPEEQVPITEYGRQTVKQMEVVQETEY